MDQAVSLKKKIENFKNLKTLESIPCNFLAAIEKGHRSGNTFLKMDQVVSFTKLAV
jgi:hypothetical protein